MRIVFLGSGAFAIPSFEALLDAGHDVAALVTQPDTEKGRGRGLAPPPLKPVAERRGVPVLQPRRVKEPGVLKTLRRLAPELQVVVAYGQILPRSVIDIAPRGTVNVHASLLPRSPRRGADPVGDRERRDRDRRHHHADRRGARHGSDPARSRHPDRPEETAARARAAPGPARRRGAARDDRRPGRGYRSRRQPQDHARASLAPDPRRRRTAGWTGPVPAAALACRVRGFHPWPGTPDHVRGPLLKVLRGAARRSGTGRARARSWRCRPDGIVVGCAAGPGFVSSRSSPRAARRMAASAFAAGARLAPGARFG